MVAINLKEMVLCILVTISSWIMTKIRLDSERSSTITLAAVLACCLSTDHVVGDADCGGDDEADQVYREKVPSGHGVGKAVNLAFLCHALLVAQDCLGRLPASTLKPKLSKNTITDQGRTSTSWKVGKL